MEKDLDGKLQDNKNNNSQTVDNPQELISIRTDEVKLVEGGRQRTEVNAKEDMEATVSTNVTAIADLKSEVEDAISKIEITLKQKHSKGNDLPTSTLKNKTTLIFQLDETSKISEDESKERAFFVEQGRQPRARD